MESVILTGGSYTMDRVSRYGLTGHLSDLAPLLEGRRYHGCGGYYRQDRGTQVGRIYGGWFIGHNCLFQVLLVAGGYNGVHLSSTEQKRIWILEDHQLPA